MATQGMVPSTPVEFFTEKGATIWKMCTDSSHLFGFCACQHMLITKPLIKMIPHAKHWAEEPKQTKIIEVLVSILYFELGFSLGLTVK